MHIFAAIICSACLGAQAEATCGESEEPPGVRISATVGQNITVNMTREDDLKEIEVSVPLDKIKDLDKEQRMWRVCVELEDPTTTNLEGDRTLLNVLIDQGQDSVNFQLPRSHAADRSKKIIFDPALSRSVDICPGQKEINENSTLRIRLASEDQEIRVKVVVNVVEKGDGWKLIDIGDDENGMQIESEFLFSNPLYHTVRLNELDLGNDDFGLGRDHYVTLRIESEENSPCSCSLLSVQKAKCPYYDTITDAKRFGRWQTMINSTSMLIDINEFTEFADEKKELLIVLIGAEPSVCNYASNDTKEKCAGKEAIGGSLRKKVTITLEPTARTKDRLKAISIVAAGYLGITIVCFIVSGVLFKLKNEDRLASEQEQGGQNVIGTVEEDPKLEEGQKMFEEGTQKTTTVTFQEISLEEGEEGVPEVRDDQPKCCGSGRLQRTITMRRKKTLEKRTQRLVAVGKSRSRYKRNQLYEGGLLIISMFYAVTVLQTAFDAQQTQYETGNNDICYFNSRCQIPLLYGSYFLDFNHFFSNVGYVVFGFTFMGIVYMKSTKYMDFADHKKELESTHGIPYLTGVYYTMGGALAMQGLMSAAYHICPTTISFQYDTTFMYLIAILIFVKLYQNRHPDSSASSVKAYIVLGFALMAEAMSIHMYSSPFWIILCVVYVLGITCLVANIYKLDSNADNFQPTSILDKFMFCKVFHQFFNETISTIRGERKGKRIRPFLIFIFLTWLVNVVIGVYFGWKSFQDYMTASESFLCLFVVNMAIYLGYYLFMKSMSGEGLIWKTRCYLGEFLPSLSAYFNFPMLQCSWPSAPSLPSTSSSTRRKTPMCLRRNRGK